MLIRWLADEVCPLERRYDRLVEALTAKCRELHVEPPAALERLARAARTMFDCRFTTATVGRLGEECLGRLQAIVDDPTSSILSEVYSSDPESVTLEEPRRR
ncbi:hypothetical protein BH24ACT5_BH24ACT5_13410 [soil metagenome]